jgi:hypothetical protein
MAALAAFLVFAPPGTLVLLITIVVSILNCC